MCNTKASSSCAYFFFDSRNADKGLLLYENLLRSLLSQLSYRYGKIPGAVKDAYEAHSNGREQPSIKSLEHTLRLVIEGFNDVYIMIDSLDECGDRTELLRWIKAMASGNSQGLHILITSRPEPYITSRLELISSIQYVHIQGLALDQDIVIYLDERLSVINRWGEKTRALIKDTLTGGADGMYVATEHPAQKQLTADIGSDGSRCRWTVYNIA